MQENNEKTLESEENLPAPSADDSDRSTVDMDRLEDDPDRTIIADDETPDLTHYEPEPPKKHRLRGLLIGLAAVILALAVICGGGVWALTRPVTIELGQPIAIERPLCHVDSGLSAIDSNTVGSHDIDVTIAGILPARLTLNIADTTPPTLTLRHVTIARGLEAVPEDFVETSEDISGVVVLSFAVPPDTSKAGLGSVEIIAADANGNNTIQKTDYTVDEDGLSMTFELGMTLAEIESKISLSGVDKSTVDVSTVDVTSCGSYRGLSADENGVSLFEVIIADTIAPTGVAHSFDLLLGQTLSDSEIVTDIADASDVTISYDTAPDFSKVGTQTLAITLIDAAGNTSSLTSTLRIHSITGKVILEAGTSTEEFKRAIYLSMEDMDGAPTLAKGFSTEFLSIGTYETYLEGEFSTIPVEVLIEDTTPPILYMQDLTIFAGSRPEPISFVRTYSDYSSLTFAYKSEPDMETLGSRSVTIIATDAAGNKSEGTATLTVEKDTLPPVIYGVKDLTCYEGETLSYRSGVYAQDEHDGKLTVKVDASGVKTSTAGTYYVTYTATDKSGNTATLRAKVTVKAIDVYAVYAKADEVLADIITSGMTQREKARAIYDWCTSNLKYSTSTSHLMGYFSKAAYSGYIKHYGNCYTYYAVASSLLTRAGITNKMIQRNDANNPHYWNLVNIDGNWYHFDTCPQPANHKIECFLLTDAEVAAYSKNEVTNYYSFNSKLYPATP